MGAAVMTDTPDAAALRARVAELEGALDQALSCILNETPEDCTPEEARLDTIGRIRAALSAAPAARSDVVCVPRDVAVQITEKLRTIARAFPGDKQTRDTLLPAMFAAAERGDAEGGT